MKVTAIAILLLLGGQAMADEPKQPPMSEIFFAMAAGVMQPYMRTGSFSSQAYDSAQQQAGIYSAIGRVYQKYEAADKEH
jgi:hypothetical protein